MSTPHPTMNYERFPEGLNPYELSDLLAGIRQLTTELAKEQEKRELTFHEKQKLDLLFDNMYWKLPELKTKNMKQEQGVPPRIVGEEKFVGEDGTWYVGRRVRTYRGEGIVTGNKTNDPDFIRIKIDRVEDHQHWYKEEVELITEELPSTPQPSEQPEEDEQQGKFSIARKAFENYISSLSDELYYLRKEVSLKDHYAPPFEKEQAAAREALANALNPMNQWIDKRVAHWNKAMQEISTLQAQEQQLRDCLGELVRLKNLKDKCDGWMKGSINEHNDYKTNQPLAWAKAKSLLNQKS